jgi:C4-dicarboxylate-specific signal transduction histidine kinase
MTDQTRQAQPLILALATRIGSNLVRVGDRNGGTSVENAPGVRGAFVLIVAILLGPTSALRADDAPSHPASLTTSVTTAIDQRLPEKTLELAERLQPDARRLVVISGTGDIDRRWREATRNAIERRQQNLDISYWSDFNLDTLLADVSRLPRNTIVLMLPVSADSTGKRLDPKDVAGEIAKASTAPVYSFFGNDIGSGIVGGYGNASEPLATETADLAPDALPGQDRRETPSPAKPAAAFHADARAMDRWGLGARNLPTDSIVLFKKSSLWDEHRTLISAGFLVIALQSLALAALLVQRRRRRQAKDSLRESEERMTFAAASANVGLWQFNRATDELWATEHCRTLFGLADDVPLTRETFLAAVRPEDRVVAVGALRGALRGERSAITDVQILHPRGQKRWISVRARSHLDDRGSSHQLNGIFVDITDQKAAESDAELQRQEVMHLMRVSVLGELSGAIAHEVNQPLTAILSNAQAALYLLAQNPPNLIEINDALQDIVKEDNRAGEVVQRLRGFLKKGSPRSEAVDVNSLVHLTIALLNSELNRRRVHVETDLADQLPPMVGDPIQLQQVLLNLIMNAMDSMATTPVAARQVTISTRVSKTRGVEVRVKDRGAGFKPAKGSKLFEPFYTTKDHGLGLAGFAAGRRYACSLAICYCPGWFILHQGERIGTLIGRPVL